MKIIGIRIIDGKPDVIKNLKMGTWYPFGDFEEPSEKKNWTIIGSNRRDEEMLNRLYKSATEESFADKMQISVQAIIGQNGSGKSTLAEIFLRLLNNFAYFLLDEKYRKPNKQKQEGANIPDVSMGRHLEMLGGFSAILYYEIDDKLLSIKFEDLLKGNGRMIFRDYKNGKGNEPIDATMSDNRRSLIMRSFFYTIYSNYSIYSFAHDETDLDEIECGKTWYSGLLHKNDGYVTPAVITPHRTKEGMIDAVHEDELATERLSVLSILYASQNKPFIDSIRPCEIDYEFDENAEKRYEEEFIKLCKPIVNERPQKLLGFFRSAWESYLKTYGVSIKYRNAQYLIDAAVSYLCYKSLKVCLNYAEFGNELGVSRSDGLVFLETNLDKCESVFRKLGSENFSSHATLKIRRCLTYLKEARYDIGNGMMSIKTFLARNAPHEISNDGREKQMPFRTYDEVFLLTLPSFYRWEIKYTSSKEKVALEEEDKIFTLDTLSSGQKQMLYSASYLVYHINNIQSIKRDDFRIIYHHINILMDEAELYYHPEYQRKLIAMIIDILGWCHVNGTKIRSINIIVLSHSPYVLSDVPNCNILYMKGGDVDRSPQSRMTETFASNIHTLLYNHFMLSNSIGEVARRAIEEITNAVKRKKRLPQDDYVYYKMVVGMISEPMLRNPLEEMLESCNPENDRLAILRRKKERIEEEIMKLEMEQIL